jgi:hypothetical protein
MTVSRRAAWRNLCLELNKQYKGKCWTTQPTDKQQTVRPLLNICGRQVGTRTQPGFAFPSCKGRQQAMTSCDQRNFDAILHAGPSISHQSTRTLTTEHVLTRIALFGQTMFTAKHENCSMGQRLRHARQNEMESFNAKR